MNIDYSYISIVWKKIGKIINFYFISYSFTVRIMTNAAITQNATLSMILSHLGRIAEKYNGERLNKALGDSGVDLDHNLTTLLLVNSSYYTNDSTLFWNAISIILENFEEHRWVNATNHRLSDITTTASITTYVKYSSIAI